MGKTVIRLMFIAFILVLFSTSNTNAELSIYGSIQSDTRSKFNNGEILNNTNKLSLNFELGTDTYHLFASPELKIIGFPDTNETSDLQNIEQVFQTSVDLREAYLDMYGFLIPKLDIRIGKQIIIWGTADTINPTGNLCPSDLSNTFDFGEKLGVNSLLMNLYISDFTLNMVFIPVFTPSLLPRGELFNSFMPDIPPVTGTTTGDVTYNIHTPGNAIDQSFQAGVKLSVFFFNYDFSLSYYCGRYSLPVMYKIDLDTIRTPGLTDIATKSRFPRVQVVGFDFAGSILDMGLWGEAGLFIPEKTVTNTYVNNALYASTTILDDIYVRFVLGTDYTFRNGLYYNVQFVHGFDSEIGKEYLNDYLITRIEKSFFYDKIKILPLTLILATGNLGNIAGNYGIGYMPELQYFPSDNLEIDIGALLIGGKDDNLLARLKDTDSLFLTVKVSF